MPLLDVTRTYAANELLLGADLDNIVDDIETFFNVTKLDDSNFLDASITGSTKLADESVIGAKINGGAVTTAKIADNAVSTAKIADSNVTTAKIADSNVTTAKIVDDAVTTDKFADESVTLVKRTETWQSASEHTTNSTTSFVWVEMVSDSITTTGRPVEIVVIPDSSDLASGAKYGGTESTTTHSVDLLVKIKRNGTDLGNIRLKDSRHQTTTFFDPASALSWFDDDCPSGSNTYSLELENRTTSSTFTFYLTGIKLFLREL